MWEINNSFQLLSFLYSVCLGGMFCLGYDVLRAVRKVFSNSAVSIFFEDVIFSVLAAFVTFTFLLSVTNGEIRGFIFWGILLGFAASRFTLSVVWFWVLKLILGKVKLLFNVVFRGIYGGFDCLEKNIEKLFKKSSKTLKKLLKKSGGMLYTKKDKKFRSRANESKT